MDPVAYLPQVDVDGVLQEVGRLSGPLLDGQHPDGLDAGLQLNHAGGLVLQEGGEEGGWRLSAGLTVTHLGRADNPKPPSQSEGV